jgi:hypothetical protein
VHDNKVSVPSARKVNKRAELLLTTKVTLTARLAAGQGPVRREHRYGVFSRSPREHTVHVAHQLGEAVEALGVSPAREKLRSSTQRFTEADEILWIYLNEAVAWGVNVRNQHERDGYNKR